MCFFNFMPKMELEDLIKKCSEKIDKKINRYSIDNNNQINLLSKIKTKKEYEVSPNNFLNFTGSKRCFNNIENKQNYKIIFEGEQKVAYIGDGSDLNTKMLNIKSILEREKDIPGEIFINMDLKTGYPTFRQTV